MVRNHVWPDRRCSAQARAAHLYCLYRLQLTQERQRTSVRCGDSSPFHFFTGEPPTVMATVSHGDIVTGTGDRQSPASPVGSSRAARSHASALSFRTFSVETFKGTRSPVGVTCARILKLYVSSGMLRFHRGGFGERFRGVPEGHYTPLSLPPNAPLRQSCGRGEVLLKAVRLT